MQPATFIIAFLSLLTLPCLPAAANPDPSPQNTKKYEKRSASLTPPIPSDSTTVVSTTTEVSTRSITTEVTTSSGLNGTSIFTTTITASAGGSSSSGTTTSTAFPSLSTYPACVSECLQVGASNANCSSIIDVACYCTNSTFTPSLVQCITSQCPDQLKSAENLAQQFCNLLAPKSLSSLSFPPTTSTSPTSSASSTSTSNGAGSPSTAPTAQPSSSAIGNSIAGDHNYLITTSLFFILILQFI